MFSAYTYYGKDEVVRDIINFCIKNPQNLNFGDKLKISYRKMEYGFSWVCLLVDSKNFWDLADFVLTAELVREV